MAMRGLVRQHRASNIDCKHSVPLVRADSSRIRGSLDSGWMGENMELAAEPFNGFIKCRINRVSVGNVDWDEGCGGLDECAGSIRSLLIGIGD